jgi:uncharacterized protein (DUF1697 family)
MAERRVALLRGINVGAHKRIPMPALRDLLGDAGYAGVRSYVQSGNLVLDSEAPPAELARELTAHIERGFGFDVAVVVRTPAELAAVVEDDPLGHLAEVPKLHHVVFLAEPIDREAAAMVEAADVAPEAVAVREREVHAWYPEGMRKSRLARMLTDQRLRGVGTARNWTTVQTLLEMAAR